MSYLVNNLAFWALNAVKRATLALNLVFYGDKLRQLLASSRSESRKVDQVFPSSSLKTLSFRVCFG